MKYSRKDKRTNKLLFLFIIAIGIGLIYLGFYKLSMTWNLLTLPISLIGIFLGYKNYKRTNCKIQDLEFKEDKILIRFLNGMEKEIKYKQLSYALLVKKFHKPVRSIELIETNKIGLFRGKSIGILEFTKWEKDIEPIAKRLIKNGFERKKWQFGWSFGDFLLIVALLLGMTEGIAESYIEEVELNLSSAVGDVGTIFSEEKEKVIINSLASEDKYLKRI